jgi:hypothetical protein
MSAPDTQATELAAFDRARDGFVAGLAAAPDAALGYLKRGDDYTLGGLVPHVNAVLERYLRLLDAMLASGLQAMTAADDRERFDAANAGAADTLDRAQLDAGLALTEQLHADVHRRIGELAPGDLGRSAPIRFPGGGEPYLTSPADVLGWLTGHYEEHTTHITELLAEWRSSP